MKKFRLRPNMKNIDLATMDVNQIDFICNAGIVNKIMAKRQGVEWNDEVQDAFDEKHLVYFIVKKNMEYTTLFGKEVDQVIKDKQIELHTVITDKGWKCIDHFIKSF
jgi:hypothetical protein